MHPDLAIKHRRRTAAALHLEWQRVWSLCHHPVGRTQLGAPWRLRKGHSALTEAEIGLRRQRPAEYKEQDSERCHPQQEQSSPTNAGAPSPPNKALAQQYRSNYQDQECDQEDRVAKV